MKATTRRALLGGAAGSVALGLLSIGCKKKKEPASCTDTTGLSPADVQARSALGYVDRSPFPGKDCDDCQQYVGAREDGACGSCKLLKGPIHPEGYCKSFSKRA
jgi:hypothetical protein